MKNIRVTMSQERYDSLMQKAIAADFPDIESFLLHIAECESPYLNLFHDVRDAFLKLNPGSKTTLRQLMGPQWDEFPRDARINVGKMFASAVLNGLIKVSSKTSTGSGHAIYTR